MVILPRVQKEKVERAKQLYEQGMLLKDIAKKLDKPEGTVRRWKSTYDWDNKKQSEHSNKKANVRKQNKEYNKEPVAEEVKSVLQNTELTEKQRLFCVLLVKYRNQVKAYQKAFECSYENACRNASTLRKNKEIDKYYNLLLEEYRSGIDIEIRDLFQWYLDIARADINNYIEIKKGRVILKDSEKFDGTVVKKISTGKVTSIELKDSIKAMDWLSEHIGIASEKQKAELELLQAQKDKLTADNIDDTGTRERVIIVNDLEEFEEKDN